MADVTGKKIQRAATLEATALGAGILAASGVGLFSEVRQAIAAMTKLEAGAFEPDPERGAFYTRLYEEVYRHLFPALQPYLQRLAELVEGSTSLSQDHKDLRSLICAWDWKESPPSWLL